MKNIPDGVVAWFQCIVFNLICATIYYFVVGLSNIHEEKACEIGFFILICIFAAPIGTGYIVMFGLISLFIFLVNKIAFIL